MESLLNHKPQNRHAYSRQADWRGADRERERQRERQGNIPMLAFLNETPPQKQ